MSVFKKIRFELKEEHIKLITRMSVYWEDGAYYGAPAIDQKRPYGNSDVFVDVAEIIGIQPEEDDEGEKYYPKGSRDKCMALHRETATALQICLVTRSLSLGCMNGKSITITGGRLANAHMPALQQRTPARRVRRRRVVWL